MTHKVTVGNDIMSVLGLGIYGKIWPEPSGLPDMDTVSCGVVLNRDQNNVSRLPDVESDQSQTQLKSHSLIQLSDYCFPEPVNP